MRCGVYILLLCEAVDCQLCEYNYVVRKYFFIEFPY